MLCLQTLPPQLQPWTGGWQGCLSGHEYGAYPLAPTAGLHLVLSTWPAKNEALDLRSRQKAQFMVAMHASNCPTQVYVWRLLRLKDEAMVAKRQSACNGQADLEGIVF